MKNLVAVAGNGLLDRRAFLRGGAALAAAMTGYTLAGSAAAAPLADDPWSRAPGTNVPAYGVPSRFEKSVVRTLSNPNGEPRTQHGRTPHHLLHGTSTPNGLHFVISHAGDADIDPEKHRLVIHGLVKRPLLFGLEALARYPMVSRHDLCRMRRQTVLRCFPASRFRRACRRCTGLPPARMDRGDCCRPCSRKPVSTPRRNGLVAEGADAPALSRSVPIAKALDDAMIALYQNGERLMPQRLSAAPAASRLGRQHEREMAAPAEAGRGARDDLLRVAERTRPSCRTEGVPVLFSCRR